MLRRAQLFGKNAAPYVKDLLVGVKSCGVTWGGTLVHVANALHALHLKPPREAKPVTVVPLCGETFGNMPTSTSASTLAERLGAFVNGRNDKPLSLGMVPAYIPSDFRNEELRVVWKLIERVGAYSKIFGRTHQRVSRRKTGSATQTALVHSLDMIITGISAEDRPLGFGLAPIIGTPSLARWSQLVIGDIAGVCLPRPGLKQREVESLDQINYGWTGLRIENLRACADRAMASNKEAAIPGVVVLAVGRQKARCVYEALRLGLLNHLVIDEDLERALENLLNENETI